MIYWIKMNKEAILHRTIQENNIMKLIMFSAVSTKWSIENEYN